MAIRDNYRRLVSCHKRIACQFHRILVTIRSPENRCSVPRVTLIHCGGTGVFIGKSTGVQFTFLYFLHLNGGNVSRRGGVKFPNGFDEKFYESPFRSIFQFSYFAILICKPHMVLLF